MGQQTASRLGADLFLPRAPSVYDARERDDMLFAYLSDSVSVTLIYETYPIGWFSIKQRLVDHGITPVKVAAVRQLTIYASTKHIVGSCINGPLDPFSR